MKKIPLPKKNNLLYFLYFKCLLTGTFFIHMYCTAALRKYLECTQLLFLSPVTISRRSCLASGGPNLLVATA